MENIPDMSELLRLARSPAGQQLLALVQSTGGSALESAIAQAASGNYHEAKNVLTPLLSSPQAKALLKQLEENHG